MILRQAERVLSSELAQLLAQLLSVTRMPTYCRGQTPEMTSRSRRSLYQHQYHSRWHWNCCCCCYYHWCPSSERSWTGGHYPPADAVGSPCCFADALCALRLLRTRCRGSCRLRAAPSCSSVLLLAWLPHRPRCWRLRPRRSNNCCTPHHVEACCCARRRAASRCGDSWRSGFGQLAPQLRD